MKNLAPHIYRQRLIIEGIYSSSINDETLKKFLVELSKKLSMTIIHGPVVKELGGSINPIHDGYEAIIIWAQSGAQIYTWRNDDFFSLDIYSCAPYNSKETVEFVKKYLECKKIEFKEV